MTSYVGLTGADFTLVLPPGGELAMRKIIGLIFALWGFPVLVGKPSRNLDFSDSSNPRNGIFKPFTALDGWVNPL
jgi:hypothetical protein